MHDLFRGDYIRLAAVTEADLPTIVRWYESADFQRLYDATPAVPRNEGQLKKWLDERAEDKQGFLFAIRTLSADTLVGVLELDGILWAHRVGWLAIAIGDPAERGKGYGADAMRLALNYTFGELNLHRLQLTVFAYNSRAIALYERLGFQREGVYRELLHRDGQRHDMILYGMLAHEWRAQQG